MTPSLGVVPKLQGENDVILTDGKVPKWKMPTACGGKAHTIQEAQSASFFFRERNIYFEQKWLKVSSTRSKNGSNILKCTKNSWLPPGSGKWELTFIALAAVAPGRHLWRARVAENRDPDAFYTQNIAVYMVVSLNFGKRKKQHVSSGCNMAIFEGALYKGVGVFGWARATCKGHISKGRTVIKAETYKVYRGKKDEYKKKKIRMGPRILGQG